MADRNFLFEIGTEELPPKSLRKLAVSMKESFCKQLNDAAISHGKASYFATPRRLALLIEQVAEGQQAKQVERQGPSFETAYDANGTPTLACLGFARSCGVTADKLKVKQTKKGKRVYCIIKEKGKSTSENLHKIIIETLDKLPINRPMRWGAQEKAFVRPVHWVLALFGEESLDVELFGIRASNFTQGHRFHHPEKITVKNPTKYHSLLVGSGKVMPDFDQRKEYIRQKIIEVCATNTGVPIIDESLLEEVTGLVEWPVILIGRFKTEFLKIPAEALITSMKVHQKCFPVRTKSGELMPCFVVVSNIESKNPNSVIKGNERVINARLSDAAFFYHNDLKKPLSHFTNNLNHVIFQKSLGTLHDRCQRIASVNKKIALELSLNQQDAVRAAELSKFDLMSEMVNEFPELQGVMGYYYAKQAGEKSSVADAIRQHYYPRYSKDNLPESKFSAALALADRLDVLIAIFGINKMPTGEKDPYSLRRAALGIIRILIGKSLPLDLYELLEFSYQNFKNHLPNTEVVTQTYQFLKERMKSWYLEQGVCNEVFSAVEATQCTQPYDFDLRIRAVQEFLQLPESSALSFANKRVNNILKKNSNIENLTVSPTLFEFKIEHQLAGFLQEKTKLVNSLYQQKNYTKALSELATLKKPVDSFFDQVMVMVENTALRNNRLALLSDLYKLFTRVADISQLP